MCQDIINLISSYLSVEQIFILYKNNKTLQDQILKIYNIIIPKINDVCKNGHLEIVKYLHECNIEPTDYAINDASKNGNLEMVKYLTEYCIDPDEYSIQLACENGHLEVVKYLLEYDIDIEFPYGLIDCAS